MTGQKPSRSYKVSCNGIHHCESIASNHFLHANKYFFLFFAGTEEYCPPEYESYGFYHGKPATVWSLGVLMFTLVCGEFPSSEDLDMLNDNIWTRDGVSQG